MFYKNNKSSFLNFTKKGLLILLLLVLMGVMFFCKPDTDSITDDDTSPENIITNPYYNDDNDDIEFIEYEKDTQIVKYRVVGEKPELKKDMILIINQDKGYLKKIENFSYENGILTIQTNNATLTELFKQAKIKTNTSKVRMKNPNTKGYSYHNQNLNFNYDLSGRVLYSNNYVDVKIDSGYISFEPTIKIQLEIMGEELLYFKTIAEGTLTFDATLKVESTQSTSQSGEAKLFERSHTFKHVIPGTPVPIWEDVTGALFVGFELDSSITGSAQTHVNASTSVTIGGEWTNNSWNDLSSYPGLSMSAGTPYVQINGDLNAKVYLRPEISVALYSIATMGIDLVPYGQYNLEAHADYNFDEVTYDYWWKLLGGVSSNLNVDLTVFSNNLYNNTFSIFDINRVLKDGGSKVKNLVTTADSSKIKLHWDNVWDANYYTVSWRKEGESAWNQINACIYYNEYTHNYLQPGTRYYYKVVANRSWDSHIIQNDVNYAGANYMKQIFSDVPVTHWAYHCINNLHERDIISGYPDNTYKPDNNVDRRALAVLVTKPAYGNNFSYSSNPHFYDVSSSDWAFKYIQQLHEENIYTQNYYYPSSLGTRAVVSEFIAKALYGNYFSYNSSPYFPDVPTYHPQFKYIQKLYQEGVISGYPDGTFKPSNNVTRAQIAAFIWGAFF